MVVLASPGEQQAQLSGHVSFGRDGGPLRTFHTLPMRDGVAVTELLGTSLPAVRVQTGGYDGPPLGADLAPSGVSAPSCGQCSGERWSAEVARETAARVADATGQAVRWVRVLPGFRGPLARTTVSVAGGGRRVLVGDIACTAYRLPTGRLLTSTAVRLRVDGRYRWRGGHLAVQPPGARRPPPCTQLVVKGSDGSRVYAVAAPGADAVQLVATATRRSVAPEPTRIPHHTAMLTAAPTAPGQQLVLRTLAADGSRLHMVSVDGQQGPGDPFDLRP